MNKRIAYYAVSFLFAVVLYGALGTPALAQEGTTPGAVRRVTLYKVVAGKMPEVIKDLREHHRPVYEEYKQTGVILDYRIFTNSTTEGQDDWDLGIAVSYKNWAALDDLAQKTGPVTLKHYGTAEKRQAATNARNQLRTVVSSRLVRDLTLNPMP